VGQDTEPAFELVEGRGLVRADESAKEVRELEDGIVSDAFGLDTPRAQADRTQEIVLSPSPTPPGSSGAGSEHSASEVATASAGEP